MKVDGHGEVLDGGRAPALAVERFNPGERIAADLVVTRSNFVSSSQAAGQNKLECLSLYSFSAYAGIFR
jgi:hypothetical protein